MIDTSVNKKAGPSDKKLVVSGVFWNGVQLVINQGFQFAIRLILAKLLLPEQFGVIGMATVFTGLVQVVNDLGIGAALVQRKESQLTPVHYYTAFWTGIVWSIGIYIILCFGVAPLAAYFYKEPILRSIIPVMSLGILVNPIVLVHQAQLTKAMNFKKITVITNSTTIFSGILAITLAFSGAGLWSLVFNSVAQIVLAVPLYFRATGWKPKWIWEKQAYKEVFGFGLYTTVTNIVNYLFNNVDYFLIGKMLSASLLGSYTLAFVLTDTFRSRLMAVMNNVMYPLYGKKQDDPQSLKKYYLKVVEYNSIVIYPIMVFFIVLGGPFVLAFFGTKWEHTIAPLQILAGSVMFHMMVNSNSALIRGLGKPGLEMKLQIVKALIFIPTLAVGILYYGIIGAAWAVLLNKIVAVIIAQFTFKYLINLKISTKEFLSAIRSPVLASVIAGAAAYASLYVGIHYIISSIIMLLSYGAALWFITGEELKVQFKSLLKKNK